MVAKQGNPIGRQTSKLARRVAAHLETAGWRLERLISDNGSEFKGEFTETVEDLGARHTRIHAGRPGNVEALHKDDPRGVLVTRLRPLHAASPEWAETRVGHLPALLQLRSCPPRPPHGGQIPADIVYGARKMEVR